MSSDHETDNNDDGADVDSLQGEEVVYEYMPGQRLNSKILWSATEQQFYRKNTITKGGYAAYKCYERECWARVLVDETTGKCVKSQNNSFHSHETKLALYNELKLKNEIKIQCLAGRADCNVREIFDKVVASQENCTLDFKKLERTLYKIRSMHEDDLKPAQKKPYKRVYSQRPQRKRRRRTPLTSTAQSVTTTDASLMASDLDQSSNVSFEPAPFDDDDDDGHVDDEHSIKPERSSEVDILEDIHFLNQSIDNLSEHLEMAELSASAMKMISDAAQRLRKIEEKVNGCGGSSGCAAREPCTSAVDDWMKDGDGAPDAGDKYDIGVNLCQTDANRLMQSGHIFFNSGKLCFSTRKKSS